MDEELLIPTSATSSPPSTTMGNTSNKTAVNINWHRHALLVVLACVLALSTIIGCYNLSKAGGHFPSGSTLPPISFFG